jgi:DNA-binding MarR family transcriptional regulator
MNSEQYDLQLASDLRTIVTRLIKKLRSKSSAGEKLSLTERSVIKLLDQHKELFPTELAAMEKITTQSMSQILNHLSEMGYISRRISDTDKRKVIITLSEGGQDLLYKTRNERDEWLNLAIKKNYNESEKDMLRKCLAPLTRLVDFD